LCLIDPRKMREPRYLDNSIFSEQLRVADIVVANKTDLCNEEDERVFRNFVAQQLQKKHIGWVAHGHFDLSWFDCAHAAPRIATTQKLSQVDTPLSRPLFPDSTAPLPVVLLPGTPFARREHRNDDYSSCGWLFAADTRFNFQRLLSLMSGLNVRRMKGVLQTDRGGYIFNADDGVLAVNEIDGAINSAVEMIADDDVDWLAIEQQLLAARC
ncbi:MAG TPA: GTP-binding protein, partial [Spongiibacteraceae bacterium]